jgi:RimJ/RimL family protein N-acetyltransferase
MTAPRIPELRSDRLVLRGHVETDLDSAAAMWSHPEVVRYIGGRPFTREEVWHRILRYIGHWSFRPFGYWAIHERAGDRFIGEIGLADWKRQAVSLECPETGWVLIPAAQGHGYASEALHLMLDWADANAIERTCCTISDGNLASVKLANKFGYMVMAMVMDGSVDGPNVYQRTRESQ